MAGHPYDYSSAYGGATGLSSLYSLSSGSSLIGSSKYFGSDPNPNSKYSAYSLYSNAGDGLSTRSIAAREPLYSPIRTSMNDPLAILGTKRTSEALYHQNILGTRIGQSEAYFSTNPLAKRPRFETASNLSIYPQRPGEKFCAHYMLTRTCKFGDSCKFDHPFWVPEDGIPDWKEVSPTNTSESLPERPGVPDCTYYIKTQKCKFGFQCKFNHPKGKADAPTGVIAGKATVSTDIVLPERPSEPICSFYAKTGTCAFSANCKYHHPKDLELPSTGQNPFITEQSASAVKDHEATSRDSKEGKPFGPFTPALLHNSKGLPIRLGETDCSFYLKTGSCKFGVTCRFNHPEGNFALEQAMFPSEARNLPIGIFNVAANLLHNVDMGLTQAPLAVGPTIYPQKPGEIECDFYMKTGHCKFGERCKFHHPVDRSTPTASVAKQNPQQNVKLTLAGLPRREGSVACPHYMKTGACKYGAMCKFDHPPPGEAIAMAIGSAAETVKGATGKENAA